MTNWKNGAASGLQSLEGHRKKAWCILGEPEVPIILCERNVVDLLKMVTFDAYWLDFTEHLETEELGNLGQTLARSS